MGYVTQKLAEISRRVFYKLDRLDKWKAGSQASHVYHDYNGENMWFYGMTSLNRDQQFNANFLGASIQWDPVLSPYGTPLQATPFGFLYAVTRTTLTGEKLDTTCRLVGAALSGALQMGLDRKRSELGYQLSPSYVQQRLKDFLKNGFKGGYGGAFAYLDMLGLGYKWHGHLEDCASPINGKIRRPDFVFASNQDICLVDGKCSSQEKSKLESITKNEWREQILPHAKLKLKDGSYPTEGRTIATSLVQGSNACLITAYGKFPTSPLSPVNSATHLSFGGEAVQRANFINASRLLGLHRLASELKNRAPFSFSQIIQSQNIREHEFDDSGSALMGPEIGLSVKGSDRLVSQVFLRTQALHGVARRFGDGAANRSYQLPVFPQGVSELNGDSSTQIVQGPDGVGMILKVGDDLRLKLRPTP